MKERLRTIFWDAESRVGQAFDLVMIFLVALSLVGMTLETLRNLPHWERQALAAVNAFVMVAFTIEYILRVWTAPDRFRYVRSFWGIVDLAAFLPFWLSFAAGSQTVRLLRLLRLLKLLRYVAALERMRRAFDLVWRELSVVLLLAVLMIFITGVGIYNFENEAQPEKFGSIPDALWFAVATLTTVGYGDAYPVTPGGKLFTFLTLMIGLGIVSLPAAVVGAAMQQARDEERLAKAEKARQRAEKRAAKAEAGARFTHGDGVCGE